MVACQWNMSSPTGPAEQFVGGSLLKSLSSYAFTQRHRCKASSALGYRPKGSALDECTAPSIISTCMTNFVDAFKRHLCNRRGGFAPDVVGSVPPNEASAADCVQRCKIFCPRIAKESLHNRSFSCRCPPCGQRAHSPASESAHTKIRTENPPAPLQIQHKPNEGERRATNRHCHAVTQCTAQRPLDRRRARVHPNTWSNRSVYNSQPRTANRA